jgi:hypothetical protein
LRPRRPITGSSRSNTAQVRAPDIAAIDHAERDHAVVRQSRDIVELFRRANEIDMETGDRKCKGGIAVAAECAEVAGEHDPDLRHLLREGRIGLLQSLLCARIEIEHQTRLVDLHPVGATHSQLAQHFHVDRQQPVEQRKRIKAGVLALGELEESDGADQHRPRLVAERPCLLILLDRLARGQHKALILFQLGHHVMIVGVEPFGHFQRGYAVRVMRVTACPVMRIAIRAARHGKIGGKRHRAALPAIGIGDRADHH